MPEWLAGLELRGGRMNHPCVSGQRVDRALADGCRDCLAARAAVSRRFCASAAPLTARRGIGEPRLDGLPHSVELAISSGSILDFKFAAVLVPLKRNATAGHLRRPQNWVFSFEKPVHWLSRPVRDSGLIGAAPSGPQWPGQADRAVRGCLRGSNPFGRGVARSRQVPAKARPREASLCFRGPDSVPS